MNIKYWLMVGAVAIDQISKGANAANLRGALNNEVTFDGENARALQGLTDTSQVNCVGAVDIIMLADGSGSEEDEYLQELASINTVVSKIEPSNATPPYPVNFGLVTFSVYGSTILNLGNYDPQTLSNAIYSAPFDGGGTQLVTGLEQVQNMLGNRRAGSSLVVMMNSDYNDDKPAQAIATSKAILASGKDITFMCFGIANGVTVNTDLMGSLCSPENIYFYPDYPTLQANATAVARSLLGNCQQTSLAPTSAPSKKATTKTPTSQPTKAKSSAAPSTWPSASPTTSPTKSAALPPAFPPGAAVPLALVGLVALGALLCVRCKKRVIEADDPAEVAQVIRQVEHNIIGSGDPTLTREAAVIGTGGITERPRGGDLTWDDTGAVGATSGLRRYAQETVRYQEPEYREQSRSSTPPLPPPPRKKAEPVEKWEFALSPLPWPIPPVIATKFRTIEEITTCACCGGPKATKTGPAAGAHNRGTTDTDIYEDEHNRPSSNV
jgi:hypothetical protein